MTDIIKPPPRRIGRFSVSLKFVDDWPTLLPVMGRQIVIVHSECRYDRRTIDYVAYSYHFDEVPDHVEPPEYIPVMSCDSGLVTVKWERVATA